MRKYFINHYRDFGNTYNLAYTDTDAQAAEAEANGWERITRKQAESKCAVENRARKTDPAALNRHQAGSVPPVWAGVANQINQPTS